MYLFKLENAPPLLEPPESALLALGVARLRNGVAGVLRILMVVRMAQD